MLEEVQDLESRGIRVEKGAAEFRRQQLELLDRQAELQLSLAQANSGLRQLMGSSLEETTPFWPEADWKVTVEPIDANAAVSDGLYRRADLNLLRMLMRVSRRRFLGRRALRVSRRSPAWPGSPGRQGPAPRGVGRRSRQSSPPIERSSGPQELAAAEEIRQAVFTVDIRLQQVAVANRKVDYFRDQLQLQRLLRQRPGSTVTALDIAAADLRLLDAQRELVHQVMALRIAQVKLKEAQGLLVFECCGCR